MQHRDKAVRGALILIFLAASFPAAAQKSEKHKLEDRAADLPAVIWRNPGDVQTLDLLYGAGGKEHAPNPNDSFTFDKEDMHGSSPKFEMKDSSGVHWK